MKTTEHELILQMAGLSKLLDFNVASLTDGMLITLTKLIWEKLFSFFNGRNSKQHILSKVN